MAGRLAGRQQPWAFATPDAWRALLDHLTKEGASVEELIEAGLVVQPEEEGEE